MSDKITRLHAVAPPRVSDAVRQSVIEELERTLQEAREGDISEIILVVEHRNPKVWSVRASHIAAPLTWIGRLEVAKQDLITSMREPEEET